MSKEIFLSLEHKRVPLSGAVNTQFVYEEITYTLGKVIYNPALDGLVTSLSWRIGQQEFSAKGIGIQTGVDIVKQFDTKLPSLVAINQIDRGANVKSVEELRLFIIIDFDKYFLN